MRYMEQAIHSKKPTHLLPPWLYSEVNRRIIQV